MENEVLENQNTETETTVEETVEVDVNEDENEVGSEEEAESEESEETSKTKKQTAEERKRYAEMRRQKEAKEREEAIKRAKREGLIEGLGGTNPYTGEKIADEIDFELYQEMRDAESKGYDPNDVKDMLKYRKEIAMAERQAKEASEKEVQNVRKDLEDFTNNHKEINVQELLNDESFQDFANDLLGKVPLESIYQKYSKHLDTAKKQAEKLVLEEKARRVASQGSLKTGDEVDSFEIDDIKKMSQEDIRKNYSKIMKSMFKK